MRLFLAFLKIIKVKTSHSRWRYWISQVNDDNQSIFFHNSFICTVGTCYYPICYYIYIYIVGFKWRRCHLISDFKNVFTSVRTLAMSWFVTHLHNMASSGAKINWRSRWVFLWNEYICLLYRCVCLLTCFSIHPKQTWCCQVWWYPPQVYQTWIKGTPVPLTSCRTGENPLLYSCLQITHTSSVIKTYTRCVLLIAVTSLVMHKPILCILGNNLNKRDTSHWFL